MIVLLRFLPYILALVAATSALGYATYRLQHWCNSVCRAQTARADTAVSKLDMLDKLRIQQDERWAQATAAEESRAKERDEKRRLAFTGLVQRARSDRATAAVSIPHASLGVLSDAHAAAEPARDPRPPQETSAPDPTAASVITWGVEMLEWSAECKARVQDWETWYGSLRQSSPVSPE